MASANGRPWRRVTAQLRELAAASGAACWLCGHRIDLGLPARHKMSFTADHIVPRSKGGPDTLDNARPAHRTCNSSRGNRAHEAPMPTSRRW
ncbi:HNH endonuclease [Amycolatopsis lurida]|uniref:HNH endonuclease n=1 Tax=Amycolatopsis lurida NRRL 2430 TaxID=1460371 RepID=A0A2P2FWB5_AMYLU|nr:HNH endonuclease signature motif containing protein [Amycolatopsis lurida]KFU81003.1 HNH endonuclease [Amycolatopsis lurida NRRL 2430]SED60791.1 HNH endonuclease [Amycolatopsis lurida]